MLIDCRYLRYVEPAKRTPKLTNGKGGVRVVRENLIHVEFKKDQAWEVVRHAYEAPTPASFIETLNHDKAYLTAYKAETELQERYKAQYNDPEMQDVYDHLDILKVANDRLVYHARSLLIAKIVFGLIDLDDSTQSRLQAREKA
jgi:hypothetical protein